MSSDNTERIYLSKCTCNLMCNGWRRPSRIRGRWVHPSNGSYQVDPLGRPYMLRAENWWILEFSPEAGGYSEAMPPDPRYPEN